MIVGALRPPLSPPTPVANWSPFDQPFLGSWHEAQLMVLSIDSRLSKYSCFPKVTLAGVIGLSSGIRSGGSPLGMANGSAAPTEAQIVSSTIAQDNRINATPAAARGTGLSTVLACHCFARITRVQAGA